jgi:hypothetical protein
MCFQLYLASDKELPFIKYDESSPGFSTQALTENDITVKARFTLPNVIYLSSHRGCGCGFKREEEEEPADREARQKTSEALSKYLNAALKTGARLEIFLCWAGDQDKPAISRKQIVTNDSRVPPASATLVA